MGEQDESVEQDTTTVEQDTTTVERGTTTEEKPADEPEKVLILLLPPSCPAAPPLSQDLSPSFLLNQHLLLAAATGDLPKVQHLLDQGADPNSCSWRRTSPLQEAVIGGQQEVVAYLVHLKEVQVQAMDARGRSALHLAVQGGKKEVVEELLKVRQVVVDTKDWRGMRLLEEEMEEEVKEMLIKKLKEQEASLACSFSLVQKAVRPLQSSHSSLLARLPLLGKEEEQQEPPSKRSRGSREAFNFSRALGVKSRL